MIPSNELNLQQGLKQELGLRLTPEMRLRIDILQATNLELTEILNREIEENPIIDDIILPEDEAVIENKTTKEKEVEQEINFDNKDARMDEIEPEDYENYFDSDTYLKEDNFYEKNPEFDKLNDKNLVNATSVDMSLHSFLIKQLNELKIDDENYNIIYNLISFINDDGLLSDTLENISLYTGIEIDKLKRALDIMHNYGFEPIGVGAANVRESLLLQLKQKGLKDSLAYKIIEKEFDLLTRQNYDKLSAIFKVKKEDIKKAEAIIKGLSPYPGRTFSGETEILNKIQFRKINNSEYITPDIFVEEDENGKFKVKVLNEYPEIVINKKLLEEYKVKKETKSFIKLYENKIKALTSALLDRSKTIKAIVEKILEKQEEFLKNEESGLKPLTLKEIAETAGVHESTVSRVVSRKYIQMPYGVIPLKKFFATGMETAHGSISNVTIKEKIKQMIENEDTYNPLTDTEIAAKLNNEGIPVARRTVTKYREQLGILSANLRKK
jgi:RNA polymerase sigma-54 factor